jgi:hypothetical protein
MREKESVLEIIQFSICLRSTGQILTNTCCKILITYKGRFTVLRVHYEPSNQEHALKSECEYIKGADA